MSDFKEIVKNAEINPYNFDKKWKVTEIIYCKLGWVIDALDGSDDLKEHLEIVIETRDFIESLQKLE